MKILGKIWFPKLALQHVFSKALVFTVYLSTHETRISRMVKKSGSQMFLNYRLYQNIWCLMFWSVADYLTHFHCISDRFTNVVQSKIFIPTYRHIGPMRARWNEFHQKCSTYRGQITHRGPICHVIVLSIESLENNATSVVRIGCWIMWRKFGKTKPNCWTIPISYFNMKRIY